MQFVPMLQLLRRAVSEGYAVPAFCVWNAESLEVHERKLLSGKIKENALHTKYESRDLSARTFPTRHYPRRG